MSRQQGRKPVKRLSKVKRQVKKPETRQAQQRRLGKIKAEGYAKRKAATPKAGPKKRRTKKEMAEARKAEAIAAHHQPVRAVKKSGRVKKYNYVLEKNSVDATAPGRAVKLDMKKPRKREEIPVIVRWLERHEGRFENSYQAMKHFQEKVCTHRRERQISSVPVGGGKMKVGISCEDCGRIRYV